MVERRNAHFPGVAEIDAYGNGGFRFADMSHRGSILCLPSGIYGWDVESADDFSADAFARVIADAEQIEFLIVGTGVEMRLIKSDLKALFRANAISSDPMSTGAAVRTYNIMLAEKRPVAAALVAV
ncbi:Mth938-like domain-containing protein [Rhizobium sp. L1K21]|uniref:Mth938-like domain-containing protein n=1 Tax=Rhizobium sp. L1K21 TaxID=2954933 RepID=UPI0020932629|nr:Mth938-like domain-containing protein [Rhizobium sp. L1K21]MCO6186142.1 Mth938-like domain-containing protein [Rhizobium sp. L1K21]